MNYRCYMITSKAEMDRILSYFPENTAEDTLVINNLYKEIINKYDITFNGSNVSKKEYLNKIIKLPLFYNLWFEKCGDPASLSVDIKNLISETENYREKNFTELCYEQRVKILKLNKRLLDITFPDTYSKSIQIKLSYEDKDLKFHDMKDSDEGDIKNIYTRHINYPVLPEKCNRIIVTGVPTETNEKNNFVIVHKPYSGIYDLVNNSPIPRMPINIEKSISLLYLQIDRQIRRLIIGERKKLEELHARKNKADSHSSQNQILSIVDSLLNRTRIIAKNANTCKDSVHSAILALEAEELLHGRSMTTALEAVSLRHQMEVRAECCFYGVAHEINIEKRFEDIAREVDTIIKIKANPGSEKLAQSYNAQVEIVNNIRLIFKEFEQFDEEDKCINMTRRLRQGLHFYAKRNSPKIDSLWRRSNSMIIEKYFNCLVSSLSNILLSMTISIFFFACLYLYWEGKYDFSDIFLCIWQSALTFIEMQDANIINEHLEGGGFNFILFSELFIAYSHLGIFITYIYQKLSRR